ncbi:MAG: Peptide chain release factor RF1 [Calditrichaeota bacterium]|nr:Peptide chain release factor RF1 [Calditrichota bacterium]
MGLNRELIERQVELARDRIAGIEREMTNPDVVSDSREMSRLGREHRRLKDVLDVARELAEIERELAGARELLDDADDVELRELAHGEIASLEPNRERVLNRLQLALVPPDESDEKTAILEIRAGAGGEEAGLFAGDLLRMYKRYCERVRWSMETISVSGSEMGGFKEVVVSIRGAGAYGRLKFESGVHRVQRVPETESQGRIHTSAASVAVLPEAEEVDVEIDANDLRIDTFRASGAGGQHVNKTDSAIRITHTPTGLVVNCQDEKSQHKNKAKAMRVLRSRLYELALEQERAKRAESRKLLVSTGDRSAKIRTYNYPQGRVTDHRINLTLYRLPEILDGELDLLIDSLRMRDAEERLREGVT